MPARELKTAFRRPLTALLRALIRLYRFVASPWVGNQCRFHPTCSVYAEEALHRHGPVRGLVLTLGRLLSCQPWSKRPAFDPVPDRFEWRASIGYKRRKHNDAAP